MKPSELIKQTLTDDGWVFTGTCRCGGMPTNKFELNTEEGVFKLRVRAMHYLISTPNTKFTKYPISDLIPRANEIKKNNQIIQRHVSKAKVQDVR